MQAGKAEKQPPPTQLVTLLMHVWLSSPYALRRRVWHHHHHAEEGVAWYLYRAGSTAYLPDIRYVSWHPKIVKCSSAVTWHGCLKYACNS
jgi:hypothetical protein